MPIFPNMPLFSQLSDNPTAALVGAADALLSQQSYSFIGYHGTSLASLRNIGMHGLMLTYAGSAVGLERGLGFYVARNIRLAKDYAEGVTIETQEEPPYESSPKAGELGIYVITRVYVHLFEGMRVGVHYDWGIQNGTGFLIPTGSTYSKMMDVWKHDTEIVLKPNVYPNISLFRTTEMIEAGLHQLPVQYERKEVGDYDDTVRKMSRAPLPHSLRRRNSF